MKPLSDAFSPEVVAELSRPYEPRDPRNAEIVEGKSPRWYVVEVYSSKQTAVADELAGYRFGIYIPEVEETVIKRGRKIDRRVPLFSGYLFVFMWPSDQHWRWLADTPGVVAIVGSLTDDEIDIVRRMENSERPIVLEYFDEMQAVAPKKRKRKRKAKFVVVSVPDEVIRTRAWSAFDDIVHNLDGEGRSEALRQMLDVNRIA